MPGLASPVWSARPKLAKRPGGRVAQPAGCYGLYPQSCYRYQGHARANWITALLLQAPAVDILPGLKAGDSCGAQARH